MTERRPPGIAHAFGDRRARIEAALSAGATMIEADLRFWQGQVWVRHERRMRFLPLLYNYRLGGVHREGPFAASIGSLWLRLDVRRMTFPELLKRTAGQAGLLLDLKKDRYTRSTARGFVATVLAEIEDARFPGAVDFCGSWPLLDIVRSLKPAQAVHYAVDGPRDWERLLPRVANGAWSGGVSMRFNLITPERLRILRGAGLEFYAWDVADAAETERALELGAAGIIGDDLDILGSLGRRPGRHSDAP